MSNAHDPQPRSFAGASFFTVADIASKKIDEAIALLNEYRNAGADGEAYERAAERLRDYDRAVAVRDASRT
jgi:hypothetical protein